jgi:hypothetical protein
MAPVHTTSGARSNRQGREIFFTFSQDAPSLCGSTQKIADPRRRRRPALFMVNRA